MIHDSLVVKKDIYNKKIKVGFFVKQGLDSFLGDVIKGVENEFETKKIIITQYNQIQEGMEWADICWFEWCDELITYGSKLDIAKERKIICRLHSYEVFTDYISKVNWSNVNTLICVGEHIKNIVLKKTNIEKNKLSVVPNGIDINKYSFKDREKGFNIAYVGYINFKKGPMLLLHTFKAIYDRDNRYKLYIAGAFQEERYVLYFQQMIKEMGLENNVVYEGWQNNIEKWLESKEYIICTSVLESQNMSVMEAMSMGIKPVIHNFVGAKEIFPNKYVWNTIAEAVDMVMSNEYNPKEYREFIVNNYLLAAKNEKINKIILSLNEESADTSINKPLVTVGIINYNYSEFLDISVTSALNQNYDNIEILIIDDASTDGSIEKIKSYKNQHKNIRVIYHQQNSGSAVQAFREIIDNAKGEYLTFLSSDDYFYDDNVISKYLNELNKSNELDYAYGNIQLVDSKGNEKDIWLYKDYQDKEIVYNTFRRSGSGVIPFTTGIFKVDFIRRNKLTFIDDPNNRVAGDTLNTLIYMKYGWKRKYVNFISQKYRQHDSNMTYDIKNRITSIISVMEYIVNNYDVQLYFPEIQWEKFSGNVRESIKAYVIGKHYWETLVSYYENIKMNKEKFSFDMEQVHEYVQPLISMVEKYLNISMAKSNIFNKEIKELLADINKIISI